MFFLCLRKKRIVTIPTNIVQYKINSNKLFVVIVFVIAKVSCQKKLSKYLYQNKEPTIKIASPNVLRVRFILIFFCEKIVFIIQIRTYISKILVMIGRTRFKLVKSEKLKVKSVCILLIFYCIEIFCDCFCIFFIADDEELLCSCTFAHDTFNTTWCWI
jgi:hypothetical protein